MADDERKQRPTPQEAVAKAKAAAAPKMAKAMEAAGPAAEKAAARAGKLFGTLRDRAKETAKSFAEGYGTDEKAVPDTATGERPAGAPAINDPPAEGSTPRRPRPRPGP